MTKTEPQKDLFPCGCEGPNKKAVQTGIRVVCDCGTTWILTVTRLGFHNPIDPHYAECLDYRERW